MAKYIKKMLVLTVATWLFAGSTVVALAQDTTPPADVEGLTAVPGNGQVTLTWDAATDDTGVTGYKIYSGLNSVTDGGGEYTFGATDAGDVLSYTMKGLTNNVTYYFAATAYDQDGNESEFYSVEVEATPEEAGVGDLTAPTVTSVAAITNSLLDVEFSEEVVLPADEASAFSIEASDGSFLEVMDAYLSTEAKSHVFVVTDIQTTGAEYVLTAGLSIEDKAGNPIISGTSDTGIFTGSSLETPVSNGDVTNPTTQNDANDFTLEEVKATDANTIELTFSNEVVVSDAESFLIHLKDDTENTLSVTEVKVDENDSHVLVLTTEDMEPGFEYILSMDEGVLDFNGNSLVDVDTFETNFLAKTLALEDLVAPEDVTNFLASILDENTVSLKWTASVDSANDLANYLLYKSMDGTTFGSAIILDKGLSSYDYSGLTAGQTYTFKVSAIDKNGNESEGVLTTVTLPESGPELLLLGAFSLLGAGVARRRKR